MPRKSRPSRERKLSVWVRDQWACVYCGVAVLDGVDGSPKGIAATVDHVVPRSKGGSNKASNLVTACWNCNMKRGTNDVFKVTRSRTEVSRLSSFADKLRAAHLARDRDGSGEAGETGTGSTEGDSPVTRSGNRPTTTPVSP